METLEKFIETLSFGPQSDPLLVFSTIVLVGLLGGWLAHKARLPAITGNILAGVLIGPSLPGFITEEATVRLLAPLSTFAMGLIAVSIGSHLSYRRIHNALRRIFSIAVLEIAASFLAVFGAFYWIEEGNWMLALLIAAFAIDTAPGTIVAIVRENRAKGSLVKTLLSVVAIDNVVSIAAFVLITTLAADYYRGNLSVDLVRGLWHPLWILSASVVLGCALGFIIDRLNRRPQFHNFSTLFLGILLCTALARSLELSPLMASLAFGIWLGNAARDIEGQLGTLAPIELLLYTTFFTLAGVTLHLDMLAEVGVMGIVLFLARLAGKSVGALAGGALGGAGRRIALNMPLALVPQAGVAIALVVLLQNNAGIPGHVRSYVSTLVLAVVVINEIIGPLTARAALRRAREAGKDRQRLVEFLEEEFILVGLKAKDRQSAIRQMVEFLVRTHSAPVSAEELFRSCMERERSDSTAVGKGVAMPHGIVKQGPAIQGVLGICSEGIDWDAPDGVPVRLVLLIATPHNHRNRHLQVLAALSKMVSNEVLRTRLLIAANANQAWEIIESEETPNYNYFLED